MHASDMAYADQPLKEGDVHISAPHIYGTILEALDVTPNSSLSFLNVGSGTGYLSSMVASILGKTGVCYGVELSKFTYEHCLASMERWKANREGILPAHMEFTCGNGLNIDTSKGEGVLGFDRIYVGAAIANRDLGSLKALLRVGGVLVAPVDSRLEKIVRVDNLNNETDFMRETVCRVSFASLKHTPVAPTVIPSRVWTPETHRSYPESFQSSCRTLFLCSNAPAQQNSLQWNHASMIPGPVWLEVLSFTHRDWFVPSETMEALRQNLKQEKVAKMNAVRAHREAEERLQSAMRERDAYKLMVDRLTARLRSQEDSSGDSDSESTNLGTPHFHMTDADDHQEEEMEDVEFVGFALGA